MKRTDEIKILLEHLSSEIKRVANDLYYCNNVNSRMSDHLSKMKELCTNMEELRNEFNILINSKK